MLYRDLDECILTAVGSSVLSAQCSPINKNGGVHVFEIGVPQTKRYKAVAAGAVWIFCVVFK